MQYMETDLYFIMSDFNDRIEDIKYDLTKLKEDLLKSSFIDINEFYTNYTSTRDFTNK